MNRLTITTRSPAQTSALGAIIGRHVQTGTCIALDGPLGAGKTQLVKGIAIGTNVPPDVMVNSPTFVIVNEYPGRVRLFHIDAYRLSGSPEIVDLGIDEMLATGVVLIEWAQRVADALPDDRLNVSMAHVSETEREVTLQSPIHDHAQWMANLTENLDNTPTHN
jgi:tRNA threonylcarbamoyladenosine biosynthesis protein TsaE